MRLKQRTYVSQRYTVTLKHLSSSADWVVCRKAQPQQLSGICTHIKSGGQKSAYVFLYLPFHHLFFYDSIHRLNGWSEQFSETIRFSRAFWREKCMFSLCHFARVRYKLPTTGNTAIKFPLHVSFQRTKPWVSILTQSTKGIILLHFIEITGLSRNFTTSPQKIKLSHPVYLPAIWPFSFLQSYIKSKHYNYVFCTIMGFFLSRKLLMNTPLWSLKNHIVDVLLSFLQKHNIKYASRIISIIRLRTSKKLPYCSNLKQQTSILNSPIILTHSQPTILRYTETNSASQKITKKHHVALNDTFALQ